MAAILRAGDLFNSFDDVEKVMKDYERASYVNFYISDSRSIGAAVSKAPRITERARKELKYHRLVYACIHGGRKFVSKSKGRRKMSTFKQECPVKVRFGLSSDGQHLVLIELNENHNHAVTQASFVHLPRQRKLDDDEKIEATMLMDMKINKQVIQEHLQSKTGKVVTLRDLHNIQHQRSKVDKQNELESVVQLLQTNEGSIVEVAITEDSCLVGIYYQSSDMLKTFAKFPELLVVDSTNRLGDLHMQLYLLMVVDGDCKSEVVATFVSADKTRDTFRHIIQTFLLHNPAYENVRAIMTDKDDIELEVLREELPNACLEDEFVESFKGSLTMAENRSVDKPESIHEKIKVVCSRNTILSAFYKELMTVLNSLSVERDHRAMQMFLKKPLCPFPANSPEAAYFQILTPHAFDLLKPHIESYSRPQAYIRDIDHVSCELSTSMGRIITTLDSCPCVFRRATGLPCCHIMTVRFMKQYSVFDRTLVPDRWTQSYNVGEGNVAIIETHTDVISATGQLLPKVEQQITEVEQHIVVAPPPAAGLPPTKRKVPSAEVRRKRAAEVASDLVRLISESPETHYAARLRQMKKLRDSWLAEKVTKDHDDVEVEPTTDGEDSRVCLSMVDSEICDMDTVVEAELIDIANTVCYEISEPNSSVKYSDVKLPGRATKKARQNHVIKESKHIGPSPVIDALDSLEIKRTKTNYAIYSDDQR